MSSESVGSVIRAKVLLGVVSPQNLGYGPKEFVFDCEDGSLAGDGLADPASRFSFYKPLAGKVVTIRGVNDRSQRWQGYIACHEEKGNELYIKDLVALPA